MHFSHSLLAFTFATLAQAGPMQVRQSGAQAYGTSQDGSLKLSPIQAPAKVGTAPPSDGHWVLNVDDSAGGHKQTIKGFGGTVTDATVTVLNSLSADKRNALMNQLFTSAGANFAFLRHTIGASDLSAPPAYTYDDNNGQEDKNVDGFGLGDRGEAMAALLAQIKSINPAAMILGSSWSAPGWMKYSRKLTGTNTGNSLDSQYRDAFAKYFVKYLQAYKDRGVTVDAITIQNEPLNSQDGGHMTMLQQADEATAVIQQNVGPALQAAGLSTKIWAYDHNTDRPDYPQTVLDGAGQYVTATAWHCYLYPIDWTVLDRFHYANPGKSQHMTECWTSPATNWHQSSSNTIGPLQNWAETSGMWTLGTWTDRGDGTFGPFLPGGCDTCRGLFVVDPNAGTYDFTIDYYVLAQYSKYIPVGAIALNGTGSFTYGDGTGVQSIATRNPDGSRTVVIENLLTSQQSVVLKTSSGENWIGPVPANAVVTWVLP